MIKNLIGSLVILFVFAFSMSVAHAKTPPNGFNDTAGNSIYGEQLGTTQYNFGPSDEEIYNKEVIDLNPLNVTDVRGLINTILDGLTMLLIPVIIFMIVFSGYKMVTAQGKPEEIKKAGNMLLWVLVGAAVILGARALSDVVKNTANDFTGSSTTMEIHLLNNNKT